MGGHRESTEGADELTGWSFDCAPWVEGLGRCFESSTCWLSLNDAGEPFMEEAELSTGKGDTERLAQGRIVGFL